MCTWSTNIIIVPFLSSCSGGSCKGHWLKKQELSRCAALKSHQGQSCVKSSNITPSSSSKLHPNPSVPIKPHTKTKLHTKPRSISNSPRKMIKKNVGRKKKIFLLIFFKHNFSLFWRGGLCPPPGGGPPPGIHFAAGWPALVVGTNPLRSPPAHHCSSYALLQAPRLRSSFKL